MIEQILVIQGLIIFSLRSIIFLIGLFNERRRKSPEWSSDIRQFVSVIVPARNEENNISDCIKSIMSNSYPKNQFELIVVNDRSTDNTGMVLEDLHVMYTNLIIIKITEETADKNLKGKPGALQAGIRAAKGDIILMTDADCIVNEKWIEQVVKSFNDHEVGLTAAVTNINGKNFFETVQGVEWTYMHTMACAGIGLNQPLGCFGNNLSVRKSVFDELGGYEKIKFSVTEDLALQQAVFNYGKKVRYMVSEETSIDTLPCKTFKAYMKQRHRWSLGGLKLGWRAALFVVSSLALWTGIISSVLFCNISWLIALLAIRIFWDSLLIIISLKSLRRMKSVKWIVPSVFFFMLMELVVPFLIFDKETTWKDQVFRHN